jgi:hypothetical protein
LGHKQSECRTESFSDHGNDSSSEWIIPFYITKYFI